MIKYLAGILLALCLSSAFAQHVDLQKNVTGTLLVGNGGTSASSASGTALDNITGFASTGFLIRTGAGTYTFQASPLTVVGALASGSIAVGFGSINIGANSMTGGAFNINGTATIGAGVGLNITSGDIQWLSNAGYGLVSANGNRQLSITNAGININNALTLPGLATSSAATTGTMCWTTGTGNVNVDTTTTCLLSSAKYKKDGRPLDAGLDQVLKLRPVAYRLKDRYNPAGLGEQVGFFAEDVAKVDRRLVSLEADGSPHAVRYQQLTALLAKAIQQQQKQIERLSKRVAQLEGKQLTSARE